MHVPSKTQSKRNATHRGDEFFNVRTQNVQGIHTKKATAQIWFNVFKSKLDTGLVDVVFLQETHVVPTKTNDYERKYARARGNMTGAGSRTLSSWAPSDKASGGVAILLNPIRAAARNLRFLVLNDSLSFRLVPFGMSVSASCTLFLKTSHSVPFCAALFEIRL